MASLPGWWYNMNIKAEKKIAYAKEHGIPYGEIPLTGGQELRLKGEDINRQIAELGEFEIPSVGDVRKQFEQLKPSLWTDWEGPLTAPLSEDIKGLISGFKGYLESPLFKGLGEKETFAPDLGVAGERFKKFYTDPGLKYIKERVQPGIESYAQKLGGKGGTELAVYGDVVSDFLSQAGGEEARYLAGLESEGRQLQLQAAGLIPQIMTMGMQIMGYAQEQEDLGYARKLQLYLAENQANLTGLGMAFNYIMQSSQMELAKETSQLQLGIQQWQTEEEISAQKRASTMGLLGGIIGGAASIYTGGLVAGGYQALAGALGGGATGSTISSLMPAYMSASTQLGGFGVPESFLTYGTAVRR